MEHRGFMCDFIDIIGQAVDKMSHTRHGAGIACD
jgi:hypothetical protein